MIVCNCFHSQSKRTGCVLCDERLICANLIIFFFFSIRPAKNELGKHKLDAHSRIRKSNMYCSSYLNPEISSVGFYGTFKLRFISGILVY